jgi:hypothetical protein
MAATEGNVSRDSSFSEVDDEADDGGSLYEAAQPDMDLILMKSCNEPSTQEVYGGCGKRSVGF